MRRTGLQMISSSTGDPIPLEDLKLHLRLEFGYTDEDEYLMNLQRAAVAEVEDMTNYKIGKQVWKVTYDAWSSDAHMDIPIGPLTSMPSSGITYKLSTGNSTQFGSTIWNYSTQEHMPRVTLDYGESWPSDTLHPNDPISFEVKVGTTSLPPRLKQAVMMLVSHWYENREPYIVGQTVMAVQDAVTKLVNNYRIWDFG